MKRSVAVFIRDYVAEYEIRQSLSSLWRSPIVGFSRADDVRFSYLKTVVCEDHDLPKNILSDAETVVSYFVPFTKNLTKTNVSGDFASPKWADAYHETNHLFVHLNSALIEFFREHGFDASVSKYALEFSNERLVSRWSQRHVAEIAGLGSFGINNMLITKLGCSGRFSSVVTSMKIDPDPKSSVEYCLFRSSMGEKCGVCVKRCPANALSVCDGQVVFERRKCYGMCLSNAEVYGPTVCGKCVTGMPCGFLEEK